LGEECDAERGRFQIPKEKEVMGVGVSGLKIRYEGMGRDCSGEMTQCHKFEKGTSKYSELRNVELREMANKKVLYITVEKDGRRGTVNVAMESTEKRGQAKKQRPGIPASIQMPNGKKGRDRVGEHGKSIRGQGKRGETDRQKKKNKNSGLPGTKARIRQLTKAARNFPMHRKGMGESREALQRTCTASARQDIRSQQQREILGRGKAHRQQVRCRDGKF